MTKKDAEITIAQCIGEVRYLIYSDLLSKGINEDKAYETAHTRARSLFTDLEEAYESYFSGSE